MTDRDHFRDEGLGTALRELEVPEHRPEFDRELEAMLARPRRDWRLPVGAALGIAAAAALILFLVGLPSSGSDGCRQLCHERSRRPSPEPRER